MVKYALIKKDMHPDLNQVGPDELLTYVTR